MVKVHHHNQDMFFEKSHCPLESGWLPASIVQYKNVTIPQLEESVTGESQRDALRDATGVPLAQRLDATRKGVVCQYSSQMQSCPYGYSCKRDS